MGPEARSVATPGLRRWVGAAFLGALWLGLIRHLSVEWGMNPQYSYGWGVPFLAAYLFWQRWQDAPPRSAYGFFVGRRWLTLACAASLFPIRLIQEANPDWRLVSWLGAFAVVGLALLALDFAGGRAWVKHFTMPVAFILVAVPWPTPVEKALVQSLMGGVAAATVECVNWIGIPAVQSGNLIRLGANLVGINEACSGVRSLQATLMAALFLGELYRFGLGRRVALLGLGMGTALVLNVGRATYLTWLTAAHGAAAANTWHDPAGYTVMLASFAALWAWSVWLRRWSPPPGARPAPDLATPTAARNMAARLFSVPFTRPTLPLRWVIGLTAWLLFVEVVTEAWYRGHERGFRHRLTWTVDWPASEEGFWFQKMPEEVSLILRYNKAESARWQREDGTLWQLFFLRWTAGRAAAQLARSHPPEVCLPATGLRLVRQLEPRRFAAQGLELPFRVYHFDVNGQPMYVFYCLWEERAPGQDALAQDTTFTRRTRLQAVLRGQRHLGQQVLEVALQGVVHYAVAEARFADFVRERVRTEPRSAPAP